MSQCVPNWDLDDHAIPPRLSFRSNSNSTAPDVPMLDYEVAELTWQNGQLAMHGLGPPRVQFKPQQLSTSPSKYTWDKPRASGTLESIVNQATAPSFPHYPHHQHPHHRSKPPFDGSSADELVPWFEHHRSAAASATMTMDALVPCTNNNATDDRQTHLVDSVPGIGNCVVGCSTRVGSCSGVRVHDEEVLAAKKRAKVAHVPVAPEWSRDNNSVTGSATFGRDSQQMTLETGERDLGVGFTSTSSGSAENTSSAKPCTKTTTADDHDSVCHSRPQKRDDAGDEEGKKRNGKSSISTKRSRAAAIHNQSERKRRDKINERMKTLQKLIPNSSKTDKASVLDEVIEHLKQLQAQVQMMKRMNMSPMMLPIAMQQQLQMPMMAPMGLGMGMGMGMGVMDMNSIARPNIPGMPTVLPATFMPIGSWEGVSADRLPTAPPPVIADPMSAFLACQSQSMTLDAYSRMAAMYQQMQQQQQQQQQHPPPSSSKN